MTRFTDRPSLIGETITEERLKRAEQNIKLIENRLFNSFIQGRLRTDRDTAPASSTDVNATDLLYDIIMTPTYQYVLVNNAGALNWVRSAYSTF